MPMICVAKEVTNRFMIEESLPRPLFFCLLAGYPPPLLLPGWLYSYFLVLCVIVVVVGSCCLAPTAACHREILIQSGVSAMK